MLSDQLRQLPYLVHTNRELGLMLKGVKPLSVFVDGENRFPEAVIRYLRLFDRHVAAGRMHRRELLERYNEKHCLHWIFIALPGEEWRVEEMIELRRRPGSWSQAREREQGRLLGYTEWQNDIWAERFPFRPA